MEFLDGKTVKMDKVENELDRLVLEFVKILAGYARYVIVNGYVAILFGRARATEDIDVIVERLSEGRVRALNRGLKERGYYCLNSGTPKDMHEHLKENLALRFAKQGTIIPNFEVKFARDILDKEALMRPMAVLLQSGSISVSPIELQIAYKRLVLKSDKDMEDAEHLERVFKGRMDPNLIHRYKMLIEGL